MAEISPLRRRMIEDMTVRNLSPATQKSYLNAVSKFSRYFGRSPDRLGLEDVHAFQDHLVATGNLMARAEPDKYLRRCAQKRRVSTVCLPGAPQRARDACLIATQKVAGAFFVA